MPSFIATSLYNVTVLVIDAAPVADGDVATFSVLSIFNFTGGYFTLNFSVPALTDASVSVEEISVAGSPI